jgi:hypothetical protein
MGRALNFMGRATFGNSKASGIVGRRTGFFLNTPRKGN